MLKLLSLFSGIGAFEKALQNLDIDYELVAYSEIDEQASKSYTAIHGVNESLNLGDITKINEKELPKDIDLLTYGYPCQDISLAGKQKGLFNEDGTRTRSGLFFDALRIIEETQPRVAIAENVKNLTSKKFKDTFQLVLDSLEQAGYNNYWQVLNAKDYGIPQNRERVFIVSIRKDVDNGDFKFPEPFPLKLRLKDMLEDEVDEKYYLSNTGDFFIRNSFEQEARGNGFRFEPHVKKNADISKTITTRAGGRMDDNFILDIDSKEKTFKFDSTNKELNLSDFVTEEDLSQIKAVRLGGIYDTDTSKHQAGSVWDENGLSPTIDTCQGGHRQPCIVVKNDNLLEPKIQRVDIPQTVRVRKYEVDIERLCSVLRNAKQNVEITNNELALELDVPQTKVEHWFRQDKHFAIPDEDIWFKLKNILNITTDEFDEAIMTFEEKEGVYEKSERHYFANGIAPTLTSTSAGSEKFIIESSDTNEPY